MHCRLLAHFPAKGNPFAAFSKMPFSTPDTAKAPAAGRRVISFSNSGNSWRQLHCKKLQALVQRWFFAGRQCRNRVLADREAEKEKAGLEPKFQRNQVRVPRLSLA